MRKSNKEILFKDVDDKIKLEFVIEGIKRTALEVLDMSKRTKPPTKKDLMAVIGNLAMAVAVVSELQLPVAEENKRSTDTDRAKATAMLEEAREMLIDIQRAQNEEDLI